MGNLAMPGESTTNTQASIGNVAMPGGSTTNTQTSGRLGPNDLLEQQPDGTSTFVLSKAEWYALQRYVQDARMLPVTEASMRSQVGMSQEQSFDPLTALIGVFQKVQGHCATFHDETFPKSVELASRVVQYNTKVPVYYGKLSETIDSYLDAPNDKDQKTLLRIIDGLKREADRFAQEAADVESRIEQFRADTEQDQRELSEADKKLELVFGQDSETVRKLQADLQAQRDELKRANDEYEHDVVVAATSPTYAWVLPFGLIAAAVVSGVYGDRAVKAKQASDQAQAQISQLEHQVQVATLVRDTVARADSLADDLAEKIKAALPVIQRIKGTWFAISGDLANVAAQFADFGSGQATQSKEQLESNLFALSLNAESAIEMWKLVAEKADGYRVNAFIDVAAEPAQLALAA